jgi:hypothetical protein
MRDIVRVDGSPGTVAALLRCGRSPRTVACLLHLSHRSAPYCRRPAASMSCTYLMPVIHCVWPVTYAFNALHAPRAWRGHDEPDVRRLGNTRAHPRATGHVAAPEPSRTRRQVWSHRTRGDTGALPDGGPSASVTWRRLSLLAQGVGLESPLLSGDGLGASVHVATPEPFPGGWRARCLGARGDIGAPS